LLDRSTARTSWPAAANRQVTSLPSDVSRALVQPWQNGWLIDDLEASACVVHGSCVPLGNRNVL